MHWYQLSRFFYICSYLLFIKIHGIVFPKKLAFHKIDLFYPLFSNFRQKRHLWVRAITGMVQNCILQDTALPIFKIFSYLLRFLRIFKIFKDLLRFLRFLGIQVIFVLWTNGHNYTKLTIQRYYIIKMKERSM